MLFSVSSLTYRSSSLLFYKCLQIGHLNYPAVELTELQVDRCLETYVLWLMGYVLFTSNHDDTVDA